MHYYIKDLTIGGKTVRCLMRGFRESADAFKALENGNIANLFRPDDLLDEPVAFGVMAFDVRPLSPGSNGQWTDWVRNDTKGPAAFELKLVIARRDLAGRLKTAADWDGGGSSGRQLGNFSEAHLNRQIEVYGATVRFGNHDIF